MSHPIARPLPRSYWRDERWALDHYADLVKRYKNRWVAVANKRVVAAAKGTVAAHERAWAKLGHRLPVAVVYVEDGRHVY